MTRVVEPMPVYVSGCSLVTAQGLDPESAFASVLSTAEPWPREVRGFDIREFGPRPKLVKTMDRQTRFVVAAASRVRHITDELSCPRNRIGTFLGVGNSALGIEELGMALREGDCHRCDDPVGFGRAGMQALNPLYGLQRIPNLVTSHVAMHLDAQGPSNTTVMDAAASLQAIGEASQWIREDRADAVVAGGTDAPASGFEAFLQDEWSRSCSTAGGTARNSEGAGLLVLESAASGGDALAGVLGFGSSFDRTTIPGARRSGAVAARSMMLALRRAGLRPGDIDAVFAAAVGAADHEVAEARAIRRLFGRSIPVVRLKPRIGNTGAASGAIETICAIVAMQQGALPIADPAPRPGPERKLRLERVLIHGMARGGLDCSLILGRARGRGREGG